MTKAGRTLELIMWVISFCAYTHSTSSITYIDMIPVPGLTVSHITPLITRWAPWSSAKIKIALGLAGAASGCCCCCTECVATRPVITSRYASWSMVMLYQQGSNT
ncbi:hypothetical protein DPV78_005391 [Talaromyces pinophilus]|nr:hypothetical protein DPV78_005391 [Talaromyces pinophilus]